MVEVHADGHGRPSRGVHHDRAYDVQGHKMFFLMRLGKLDHDGGMQLFGCGDDSQNVFEPGGVETADSSSSGISLF